MIELSLSNGLRLFALLRYAEILFTGGRIFPSTGVLGNLIHVIFFSWLPPTNILGGYLRIARFLEQIVLFAVDLTVVTDVGYGFFGKNDEARDKDGWPKAFDAQQELQMIQSVLEQNSKMPDDVVASCTFSSFLKNKF